MQETQKKIVNVRKINKMRWITGIVVSSLVIIATTVTLVLNLTNSFNEDSPEAGLGTLKMFTTNSNVIAAISAFMCLPFQIDGLRRDRYKLPPWIVIMMYVGTVGSFLTFFTAITLLSITKGFVIIMFSNSNLFMHTINPILITLLFVLILSDVKIKFRDTFFAFIPIVAYALFYFIAVFVTKVWTDVYQTDDYFPWPVSLLLVLIVAFGISQLIRVLHNLSHKYVTKKIQRYYLLSEDYQFPKVSDAVRKLAQTEVKFYHERDDISIPTDIIAILSQRYNASPVPLDILYDIYFESYLIGIKEKKNQK